MKESLAQLEQQELHVNVQPEMKNTMDNVILARSMRKDEEKMRKQQAQERKQKKKTEAEAEAKDYADWLQQESEQSDAG